MKSRLAQFLDRAAMLAFPLLTPDISSALAQGTAFTYQVSE